MKHYDGSIPPCGIFCGGCPRYKNGKTNSCDGADSGCKSRKCKSIYVCCIEKRSLAFCHQCKTFPCSRFKKFAETWKQYNEDLVENQKVLKEQGVEALLGKYNEMCKR